MATTTVNEPRMRQLVDWSAAIWAGIVGGIIFLVLNLVLSRAVLGISPWAILRYFASPVLGEGVLPPPIHFRLDAVIVGIIFHMLLSIVFAMVIAFLIHRWGIWVGIILGGLLGLALYVINFYNPLLPQFSILRSWVMLVTHIVFGALAGGIYEALEVEEFVPVEE